LFLYFLSTFHVCDVSKSFSCAVKDGVHFLVFHHLAVFLSTYLNRIYLKYIDFWCRYAV
jgi:hypothetical protein